MPLAQNLPLHSVVCHLAVFGFFCHQISTDTVAGRLAAFASLLVSYSFDIAPFRSFGRYFMEVEDLSVPVPFFAGKVPFRSLTVMISTC